jgi:hypothetical protein
MPNAGIEVKVDNKRLVLKIQELTPELEDVLFDETKKQSDKLTNYIIKNHLTGGTSDTKLKVRSGSFRRLTLPIKPKAYSAKMRGGTQFAGIGARVHVGPKNQVTTIKPIASKYLAIPIGEALNGNGVARYSGPRSVPGLSLITSRKGNKLLARTSDAGIEPFFLLLKQVEVKARVHPDEVLSKNIKAIASDYRKAVKKALDDTVGRRE